MNFVLTALLLVVALNLASGAWPPDRPVGMFDFELFLNFIDHVLLKQIETSCLTRWFAIGEHGLTTDQVSMER